MSQGGTAHPEGFNQNNVSPENLSAVQNNTVETPVEPEAKSPPVSEEPALSSQYAVLARKEKALRAKAQQQEQALKAREAALAAKEAEITAKAQADLSKYIPKDRFQEDPLQALLDAGVTYEQLTERLLNQPQDTFTNSPAYKRMEAKIAELEGKTTKVAKSYEEQQSQQYQQALQQITNETKNLITSDPINYEAIAATGSVGDVVELIEKTFKEDGVLLSVEEAAKEVEEYLAEEATKLARLKKIQQRLAPKTPPQQSGTKPQPQQQTLKTLTNSVGTGGKLSARERALLAFKGELK
ncbi:unnamed protein product [Sphagnum balticum]